MYHYVYRITNKVTGKHYYGKRSSKNIPIEDLGKKYFSSSKNKSFIKEQKDYPERFKYKVVKVCESEQEALLLEVKLHLKFNVKSNNSFINNANQTSQKFSTSGKVTAIDTTTNKVVSVDKETFEKSENLVGVRINSKMSDSHKKAISKANKGRTFTETHKQNIGKANKGRPISEATKRAFELQRSKPATQETKDKLSKALKGRRFSEEHKLKLSLAQKGKKKPCTRTKEQLLEQGEKVAKRADIYCHYTNEIIASDVIISRWAKINGYDAPQLGKTTRRDLSLPRSSTNVYHHKGIYAIYKEK
jgi:hypothetical protein